MTYLLEQVPSTSPCFGTFSALTSFFISPKCNSLLSKTELVFYIFTQYYSRMSSLRLSRPQVKYVFKLFCQKFPLE